jgi:hypothetical protein
MRPKVVILTLVVAFGLLGMVVILKGLTARHADNSGGQPPGSQAAVGQASGATNAAGAQPLASSGNTANSEALRAVVIQKELDQIQELAAEVDGTNNPVIIAALVGKVQNPETDVRKAALAALVQISDTNVVSELQRAADGMTDPRAKVDVMDTIDYLSLPNAFPAVQPPETFSNYPVVIPPNIRMNAKFLHTNSAALHMQNSGQ